MQSGLKVDINLVTPHLGANDTRAHMPKVVIIESSTVFVVTLKTTVQNTNTLKKCWSLNVVSIQVELPGSTGGLGQLRRTSNKIG